MFNDPVLIGGVAVGLALGSFGYVLFRFGWRPARRYRQIKKQILTIIGPRHPNALDGTDRDRLRQLAVDLHTLTTGDMPSWYRLALERRGENPDEAVRQIQSLVNCRDHAALGKRREAVGHALGTSVSPACNGD